jgi:hypothetical protein
LAFVRRAPARLDWSKVRQPLERKTVIPDQDPVPVQLTPSDLQKILLAISATGTAVTNELERLYVFVQEIAGGDHSEP